MLVPLGEDIVQEFVTIRYITDWVTDNYSGNPDRTVRRLGRTAIWVLPEGHVLPVDIIHGQRAGVG
jgi:hypothetical protein